jgi:hypothetical protein
MDSTGCSKVDAQIVETYWQMVERHLVKAGLSRPAAEMASFTFQRILWDEKREAATWGEDVGGASRSGDVKSDAARILEEIRASYRLLDAGKLIEGNAAHTRHLELRGEILGLREDFATLWAEMARIWFWVVVGLSLFGIVCGFIAGSIA